MVKYKWEDLLDNITSLINVEKEYKHGRKFVIASDIAQQFYCEQKVENSYSIGEISTEAKEIGTMIHDEMIKMEKVERSQLINEIKSGKELIASFLLLGEIGGVTVVGKPDAILFVKQRPVMLIELKTTKGSVSKLWPDQELQAQIYAYLLEQVGFDISKLRIFVMKVCKTMGDEEKST
jgi:hypothetical protein